MPKYVCTVIFMDKQGLIHEYSDIIEAESIEHAVLTVTVNGYIIRDLRTATSEDLQLQKLKEFRNRLLGIQHKQIDLSRRDKCRITIHNRHRQWLWLLVLIVVLIIVYVLVNGLR